MGIERPLDCLPSTAAELLCYYQVFSGGLYNFEDTVELPQQNSLLAFNKSSCTDAGHSHA